MRNCWTDFYDVKDKIVVYDSKKRKRSNTTSIGDSNLLFLKDYFENWVVENTECVDKLRTCIDQPQNDQKRKSEYAYWIQKIAKRSNFEAIFELFNENINHKDRNEDIVAIKDNLVTNRVLLESLEKQLLPSQSLGLEIERASLNYYTVNKKPKNYDTEIKNQEELISQKYNFKPFEISLFGLVGFSGKDLPIDKLKEAMKIFKAKQKSKFYEFINSDNTYDNLGNVTELKLLNDISRENFNKFKVETDKNKRGKHFQFSFKKYQNYCNLYKNIAVSFGKINAVIKALEKEKIDAERVQSWAMIIEKDDQRYIVTIPRDANNNLTNAKRHIDSLANEEGEVWTLYTFESLTLRALDKLCFGFDKNTFYPAIKDELKHKENSFFDWDNLKRKDQFSDDGKELIKFYQAVLGLDATKKMLSIDNFDGLEKIINKEYENRDEFERDLKQACYYKKTVTISDDTKTKLISDFQGNLYKATSYDLEKDDEEVIKLTNKKQFDRANPEFHTKIWLDFWLDENEKNNYEVRLNPEFKINFIEENPESLKDKKLGVLNKNRKKSDRFLLSTTITFQAHDKNADLAFKETKEITQFIDEYNKDFNKKIKPWDIYYYGLDRGQKELVTLGIYKFSETEKVEFTKENGENGNYPKPAFIDLKVYQIKENKFLEKNEKGRVAYKSISEFMENTAVLEEISVSSCFDMSCAKLIKDKVVVNGDIATYLELKRVSALRKIYEGATKGKFKSDSICFDEDKGSLFLHILNRGELKNENLYFYDKRFEDILPLDAVKKELQDYYDALKTHGVVEMISIDKINHLRDALCANAVGILNHLQKQYFGLIVFENLDIDNKNQRISEFSENLASRIEWKILQKFQTLSLIPPHIKKAMELQGGKEIDQLGLVVYIKTSGTSSNCPHCGTRGAKKDEKWKNHAFVCKNINCNFSTKYESTRNGLIALDNSDSVATYNIAKRGLDLMLGKKCRIGIGDQG
jgi:hypothetical protein